LKPGDEHIDLELRRPAESLAGGAIGGVEHAVALVAKGAEKQNAVLGIVVDEKHAGTAREGLIPGRLGGALSARRLGHP
jgi:hypothetical protein